LKNILYFKLFVNDLKKIYVFGFKKNIYIFSNSVLKIHIIIIETL